MDDRVRYRIALQKSLLAEGWEDVFDYQRLRDWVKDNRDRLRASARAAFGEEATPYQDEFALALERFQPISNYDLPTTEAIFRPLFDAVIESAAAIGLRPIRNVELVTSTSISPTPFARPTTDTHQLFVGLGTSAFCNYWAKAYTAVVKALSAIDSHIRITTADELHRRLSANPMSLLLAARLSLYYAATGTLLGFGDVVQPTDYWPYRTHLLQAMEVFVLAHEYAHFIAHERELEFLDEDATPSTLGLEYFCDEMGLRISREWGSRNDNWLAFTGVGAIALLRALDSCELCVAELTERSGGRKHDYHAAADQAEETHPPVRERIANLTIKTVEKTANDQKAAVAAFLAEYDLILGSVGTYVSQILREAISTTTATHDSC